METNNPLKAGALILNNLAMFNEAAVLMAQQITGKIFEEIQEITQKWIIEKDWEGEAEWLDGEENIWTTPKEWFLSSKQQNVQLAVFWFGYEDETDSYNVADLCGCGQTRMGFYFGKSDVLKKSAWKIKPDIEEIYSSELKSYGFIKTSDKYQPWFLPVTLDSGTLAIAYENEDYDEAMKPLRHALENISNAQRIFDKIVQEVATAIDE